MGWDAALDPTTAPYKEVMMAGAKSYWEKMTPEERSAEIKRRMTKRKKSTRKNSKSTRRASSNGRAQDQGHHPAYHHVSYLYGKVETLLEHYSHSNGVPFSTLADGVASLLRHKEGR